MRFIQKAINKYMHHQLNKPKYKLKDLYIAEIDLLKKREMTSLTHWVSYYDEVKKYALFTCCGYNLFKHIKSGQKLIYIDSLSAIEGDYVVNNLKEVTKVCAIQMRRNNWNKNTKLSKNQIQEIETAINEKYAPNQKETDLFGM